MKKLPPYDDLVAGDTFRNSLLPRADVKKPFPLWHGWALMDAFLAGAEYARSSEADQRDAARYRWLRANVDLLIEWVENDIPTSQFDRTVDANIKLDAAMSAQSDKEESK